MDTSGKTKIEYNVKAKSNYRNKSVAHNVEISIPVPNDLKSPVFRVKKLNNKLDCKWSSKLFTRQRLC